jgi:hypothetical protein
MDIDKLKEINNRNEFNQDDMDILKLMLPDIINRFESILETLIKISREKEKLKSVRDNYKVYYDMFRVGNK